MIELKETDLKARFFEYCLHVLQHGYMVSDDNTKELQQVFDLFENHKFGAFLTGNPGSGKTFIFQVLQKITPLYSGSFFAIKNCHDVVQQFNVSGHEVFDQWKKTNILFDDLGTEDKGMFYQDRVEVMEKFIQLRYDLYKSRGLLTYFTSNSTPAEIKQRYGDRVDSRLREMCDYIVLGGRQDYTDYRRLRNFKSLPSVKHPPNLTEEDKEWQRKYEEYRNNPPEPVVKPEGMGARLRKQMGL